MKEQLRKLGEEIKKQKEKMFENIDNYSTIQLQYAEQNAKNSLLKAQVKALNPKEE